jgi:Peptidase family M48
MTNEQFDQLVNRIQKRSGARPFWLRCQIVWWLLIGYAGFLAGLLLVILISTALVIMAFVTGTGPSIILMAIVALLLTFGICQAFVFLWVPLEIDRARTVTEEEVPKLFQLLSLLQEGIDTPTFRSVQITPHFNACVQFVPRWGVFGRCENHLYLGLPLMQMLTPEQFSAVLAHESAHASSRHDRFGMWVYRVRRTWSLVFAKLQGTENDNVSSSLRIRLIESPPTGGVTRQPLRNHCGALNVSRGDCIKTFGTNCHC